MPPPNFFRNLGVFVRSDFLDATSCLEIQSEMRAAESQKALINRRVPVLDETTRKALVSVHLEKCTKGMVRDRIMALKPSLEAHFRVLLKEIEKPAFLRYGEGAFYKPHRDVDDDEPPDALRRKISVVVFLDAKSKQPETNCYGGGALTFYGLLDGLQWEKCAFSLDAEPGLLVAFLPGTVHEVRPVTFGERFTIVTWFLS